MQKQLRLFLSYFLTWSILLIFGAFFQLKGQGHSYEIRRYISNSIDIRNQNWSISQNPINGLVYFANSEGLVEYNGISQKIYHLPYNKSLRSVCVDKNGIIYTGAFEDIGYWKINKDSGLVYHSLDKLVNIEKNDEIWKIYAVDRKIYFQSFTTIYIYDGKTITTVKSPFSMLFMFPAGKRFIVQIIDNGLYWFDGKQFDPIPGSNVLRYMKIHSVIRRPDGNYFICTAAHGIYDFDGKEFRYFDSPVSHFLEYQTCNAGLCLNDSLYVYGSILDGIVFSDKQGDILKNFNYANGLNNNTVLALYADHRNGLWIGLDEGVSYIDVNAPATYYSNTTGTLGTIYAIEKENNELYLGTNHGLFVANISGTHNNLAFNNVRMIPNSQGQVWTLNDIDGQLLCGHNDGTFLVENNKLKKISDITGGWSIKPFDDELIEGTYTGLVTYVKGKNGKWKEKNKIKAFGEPIRHVEVDYLGYVWASHLKKGLYKIELNEKRDSVVNLKYFSAISHKPYKIDVFKINNRIVFTTSNNIYTYDHVADSIIPFTALTEGIGDYKHSTQVIPFQKNEYFFVNGNKIGLFYIAIDFSTRKILEINQENGNIPERDLQVASLNKNTIIIPNRQGFTTYDLSSKDFMPDTSALFISRLVFQGKGKSQEFNFEKSGSIHVPYNQNNLTVYFADPSHFSLAKRIFQYRIPEIEETWHNTLLDNFSYLNLKYGDYHLQIKSETNNKISGLAFTLNTPWYLSKIAIIIYIILFVILVYLGFSIFRLELRKQKHLIEIEMKKDKLESELDRKSQELIFTMRYLIKKNDILTRLQEQIGSMKHDSSRYPVRFIRNMELVIKEGLESQTREWKNAIKNLELTGQGFFKKLLDAYPDLTPNDLRLCSYLRMNFNTKEMAKLLNVSPRGVEISRYRLRKKMDLDHDVNLTEFLMSGAFNDDKGK